MVPANPSLENGKKEENKIAMAERERTGNKIYFLPDKTSNDQFAINLHGKLHLPTQLEIASVAFGRGSSQRVNGCKK